MAAVRLRLDEPEAEAAGTGELAVREVGRFGRALDLAAVWRFAVLGVDGGGPGEGVL